MVTYFLQRFAYTSWADREALASLERCKTPLPRALQVMGHIVAVEMFFLNVLRGEKPTISGWPDWNLAQCAAAIDEIHPQWKAYLSTLTADDMATSVRWPSRQGDEFSAQIGEILTQVVTHGSYHRGQIAAEISRAGYKPAMTDFIYAARNKLF